MELLDILDENGNKTGDVLSREEASYKKLSYSIIIVAIIKNNEILVQKRSKYRKKQANMWDLSVAGHVLSKETNLEACVREVKEEIGLDYKESEFRFICRYKSENLFFNFFTINDNNISIEDIKLQKEEVEEIKFIDIKQLNDIFNDNFIPSREECLNKLNEIMDKGEKI